MDKAIVDLAAWTETPYVMVSRVRRLDDLLSYAPFQLERSNTTTTSIRYLAVIVYFLSKTKLVGKELQAVVQAKSDINTKQRRDDH